MKNPWIELTKNFRSPYILQEDRKAIEKYNKKAKSDYKIAVGSLPIPFIGDPFKAKVIFLQLNPGLDWPIGFENQKDDFIIRDKKYKEENLKNLLHKKMKFPFFDLNPDYRLYGGFRYWTKVLSSFIKEKKDYKIISKNICCLEYFPYHSKKFDHGNIKLKNQEYLVYLLNKIIKKKNIQIIMMKGEKWWLKLVPELRGKYIKLKSTRNVILSKNNLVNNFKKIEKIIK
ncbi:MAG TPA: hypothetical protein P5230_00485 [Candidatus Magasanikbacteria bacterium]|nr:hypothetical protein [Candidatus Magasanikbacteria bacterium]